MKHPFYFTFAATTCLLLYLANDRGWSLLTKAFNPGGYSGARSAGLYHK